MIKYEITINSKRVEIITAPDIIAAFEYSRIKYGSHKVYVHRYFGKEK